MSSALTVCVLQEASVVSRSVPAVAQVTPMGVVHRLVPLVLRSPEDRELPPPWSAAVVQQQQSRFPPDFAGASSAQR